MNSLSLAEIEAILENLLLEAQTQLKQTQHRQATRLATLTRSATALSASLDDRIKHIKLGDFIKLHQSDQSVALHSVLQAELVTKHDTQNKRKRTAAPTPVIGTDDEPGQKKSRTETTEETAAVVGVAKKKSTRNTTSKSKSTTSASRSTRTNNPIPSTSTTTNPLFSPSTKEFTYEPPLALPHNSPSPIKAKKSRKPSKAKAVLSPGGVEDAREEGEGNTTVENAFAAAVEKLKKSVEGMSEKDRKKMEAKYGFALS